MTTSQELASQELAASQDLRQHAEQGAVPIRGFLTHQAFDPEAIRDMSAALEAACKALQLNMCNDPATRLVAEKIIALAQRGVCGEAALLAMTLEEFNVNVAGSRGDDEVHPPPSHPAKLHIRP